MNAQWTLLFVDSAYLDRLAEEVNDKLQEAGLMSISELCKNYDLPGDFLSEVSPRPQHLPLFVWEISPCASFFKYLIFWICLRSCQSAWGSSSKEKWTSTTEGSYSLRPLLLVTKPKYEGFSAPSQGKHCSRLHTIRVLSWLFSCSYQGGVFCPFSKIHLPLITHHYRGLNMFA